MFDSNFIFRLIFYLWKEHIQFQTFIPVNYLNDHFGIASKIKQLYYSNK